MEKNREQIALDSYLKLIEEKGADQASLDERRVLLENLLPLLSDKSLEDSNAYQVAVDEALKLIDREKWSFFLLLSREYSLFWKDDMDGVAEMSANGGFNIKPLEQAQESLRQIRDRLDSEKFSLEETQLLQRYLEALRGAGASNLIITTREKLIKLLIVQLRQAEEKNGQRYRASVATVLPLFGKLEAQNLFLTLAREFYYFWSDEPDAASHIMLKEDAP